MGNICSCDEPRQDSDNQGSLRPKNENKDKLPSSIMTTEGDATQKNALIAKKKKPKKPLLPAHLRNLIYSFLDFKTKFRMIYLCK